MFSLIPASESQSHSSVPGVPNRREEFSPVREEFSPVHCSRAEVRLAKAILCYNRYFLELSRLLNDAKRSQLKDPRLQLISAGQSLLDTRLSETLVSIARVPESLEDKLALVGGWQGLIKNLKFFEVKTSLYDGDLLIAHFFIHVDYFLLWNLPDNTFHS